MDWSALPLDVFLKIARFHASDFLFLLSISGVCSSWRSHSAWIERLVVFWPPLLSDPMEHQRFKMCGRHKADLHQCSCFHDSISAIISRLHKVRYLFLTSLEPDVGSLLDVEKLRDSDWEKLRGSVIKLHLRAGAVSSRVLGFVMQCRSLIDLRFSDTTDRCGLEGFFSHAGAAGGDQTRLMLESLRSLQAEVHCSTIGLLQKFLGLCPNLKKMELHAQENLDFEEHVRFEVPENVQDYYLKFSSFARMLLWLSANRARVLEICGGLKFFVLESAEWLEELILWPNYLVFSQAEKMERFWRLTLNGSYWGMHEARMACDTAPTTKRLCLGSDFNVFHRSSKDDDDDNKVECYSLFSGMFRGGHIEELELTYGFNCRMWLDEEQEELDDMIAKMPRMGFLILDLEVGAEEKLDIPRFADAVELLVKCCRMEWISLSYTEDINEDVNFHSDCFDKNSFSAVVNNILCYGYP